MKEVHRMENSFTDKLEKVYQRVDNRLNSIAQRNQISRTGQVDAAGRNRRHKPVCYKSGRVGHIQYSCYYYHQPEDPYQNHDERQCRANYMDNQENQCPGSQSSVPLCTLDAQYAQKIINYHVNKADSSGSAEQTSRQPVRLCNLLIEGEENSPDHVLAALPKREKTNSQAKEQVPHNHNRK